MVLVSIDYYPELDIVGGVAPLKVGITEFKVAGPANRRNDIDSTEWEKIKKLPSIAMRLDKGILRLVGGGQPIITSAVPVTISVSAPTKEEPQPSPVVEPAPQQPPEPVASIPHHSLLITETAPEKETRTRKARATANDTTEPANS